MKSEMEGAILSKITWRLIPFLFLLYIVAYLDRANVGFAKLEMSQLPWFNEAVFSLGSGIFFIGYFLFEVPSNLLLQRVGARWWIARIMVTWGLIASGMLFCSNAPLFYGLRFLLGVAEAGFFPGVILYLTYWYTSKDRARMVALFMTATALANALGSPLSGWLLHIQLPPILANWQWMFLLEGLPSVLLGFVVLLYLPDGPRDARWLTQEEKDWVVTRIAAEESEKQEHGATHFSSAFSTPGVLPLCLLYFTIAMTNYGVVFWLPTLIKNSGVKDPLSVGLLTAIPYAIAAVCMVLNGLHSDRTNERKMHVAGSLLLTSTGLFIASTQHSTAGVLTGMGLAVIGIMCPVGPFWALPTSILGGTAAAAGIAFINSVGNLGGFTGPFLVGKVQEHYPKGAPEGVRNALYMLAGVAIIGAITALSLRTRLGNAPGRDA